MWDTTRPAEPVRVFALAAHADCIWDLDLGSKSIDALPEGTFTTASSDGSIRYEFFGFISFIYLTCFSPLSKFLEHRHCS